MEYRGPAASSAIVRRVPTPDRGLAQADAGWGLPGQVPSNPGSVPASPTPVCRVHVGPEDNGEWPGKQCNFVKSSGNVL